MDVNLPFLGTSEASGPSVDNFNVTADIGVLVATVPVDAKVYPIEHIDNPIAFFTNTKTMQSGATIDPIIKTSAFEVNANVDINVKGHTTENIVNHLGDILVQANAEVYYYDLTYSMLNLFAITQRKPFFAGKIVGNSSMIDSFNMVAESSETGNVIIGGSVLEEDTAASVDINVPVHTIANGFVENLSITGVANILDYVAVSPVTTFAISMSMPISMLGTAQSGSQPEFSVEASINNVDVLLSGEVFDQGTLRYEIADIDHGVADGKVKIFPNQWTLCFANKPVNDDGVSETVSSFLVKELVDKYGSDIHTKISMIVGKHPETGEEYNFVVQEGYITPEGSMNDFNMCYLKDGAFYPIPFMVQSVSDETLEIDWAV